jgi:hypothetical protein
VNAGLRKSIRLERVVQECCQYLKCKIEDLFPIMKTAIEEGGKEKVTLLERERILDQNRIRTLKKKVQELTKIDDLNQNLLDLGKSVRILLGTEPELMIANNLVKQVHNDDKDPKLVKIISCNKKYAAEIQEAVGKLSASIDASLEYLVAHATNLEFKEEDVQMIQPKPKTVQIYPEPDSEDYPEQWLFRIQLGLLQVLPRLHFCNL